MKRKRRTKAEIYAEKRAMETWRLLTSIGQLPDPMPKTQEELDRWLAAHNKVMDNIRALSRMMGEPPK